MKDIKSNNQLPIIAIVDGYGIGKYFAPKLKEMGYSCIHIQSSGIPKKLKQIGANYVKDDYIANIVNRKDKWQTIQALKKYNIKCIFAGYESGVELADFLSEKMGLPTNGTKLSHARRNKFEMIEAVKSHNLNSAEHIESNNLKDILKWASELKQWPIVLKPSEGAATDRVFFCKSNEEIEKYFDAIKDGFGLFGKKYQVLAESYLEGDQYIINAVSCEGQHVLSDLWICGKKIIPGASIIFDHTILLPYSFDKRKQLADYIFEVLNALGIKYGASHSEVILMQNGPVLLESAARIMGAVNPSFITQAIGRSQLELTIDSYLSPKKFLTTHIKPYNLKKHLLVKFIISEKEGKIKNIRFLEEISKLKSFGKIDLNVNIGSYIKKSINTYTMAGSIYLIHKDISVINNDYLKLTEIEKEMFEVESE